MSDYPHTIPELRAALSSSQVLLDEAAGAEGCPDLLPDWREHPSATFGVDADASSELIDLTDLLDVWEKYLDEKARVRLEVSFEEPTLGFVASDHGPELDLQAALQKCQAAAETGYQKALAHVTALGTIAGQTEAQANRLGGAAMSADKAEFKRQIDEVVQTLEDECSRLRHDIDDKRNRLNTFNLTLFGRTMTGKSTLMEILTRGDGSSIGKGGQRTTRDVRAYEWNRLTITDVPGIAAPGGADDEETAHVAAKQADLVLFLISDDGPQAAEAEHLSRLRRQGKSVVGIFNVKAGINASCNLFVRRFLCDQEKLFDDSRLRSISCQFDEMVDKHVPGQRLELVNAHLHARYLAGLPEHENKPWRNDLERFSRFQDVENRILHEVAANGPFLRTHSFLNIAAVANLQAWESARKAAELCDTAQGRLKGRLEELRSWQTGFIRKANQSIDRLIQQTAGTLRNEIPSFAGQYCEDRSLAGKWNARVRNAGMDEKCQALQKQLAEECQNYFKQLLADLQQELTLLENQFDLVSIATGPVTNTRRRWNWGVNLASGGVTAALGVVALTNFWNPGGWVAMGVLGAVGLSAVVGNLIGRMFTNRDEKRREAIAKITSQLRQNVDGIERQVRDGMKEWLGNFTEQHVNRAEAQFSQLVESQEGMANFMRDIADRQRKSLLAVNWDAAAGALRHLGEIDAVQLVYRVARIPGQAVVLTTVGASSKLSADVVTGLESLLQEKVVNVPERMSGSGMRSALKSFGKETSERLVGQLT